MLADMLRQLASRLPDSHFGHLPARCENPLLAHFLPLALLR